VIPVGLFSPAVTPGNCFDGSLLAPDRFKNFWKD